MGLEVGAAAPAINATSHDNKTVTLESLSDNGKNHILLWFYPRASTGG
jgi:peroxiredoxin